MTTTETLQSHLTLCDELYQLALEENRFLKQNQRVPEPAILERKRALLARLEQSVAALKTVSQEPAPARPDVARKEVIERSRAKILQILHLDRENEQLLLRYSLGTRPKPAQPVAPAAPSQLQRIYERHA